MYRKQHILALLLVLTLTGCVGGDTVKRFAPTSSSDSGSIAVPGCETLSFKAGSKTQTVNFANPPENACVFVLSLVLDDSGETLWTGKALRPGEAFTRITLSRTPDAGDYAATLRYDCFSTDDHAPLNGAEIKLTLRVT